MDFLRSFLPLDILRKIYGLNKRRIKPPIIQKEEEELQSVDDSSSPSPFHKLPLELIADKIFSKLCIADQIRTRSVCKWWKSAKITRCRDEAPWLIMPEKGDFLPSEIRLKSTLENRIYRFQLPRELSSRKRRIGREDGCRRWCCCGSSDGWLLLAVGGDLTDVELVLWNPLSGEIKNLPSPSTLFFFCRFNVLGLEMSMSAIIRCARVLSSSSCSSLVVAIVLSQPYAFVTDDGNYGEPSEQLALCCTDSHDPWWRPVGGVKPHGFYQDICFHKGKLYALCRGDDFSTRTVSETCKYKKVACDVVLLSIRYDWPPIVEEEGGAMGVSVLERESRCQPHLVECSLTGELLVVTKVKDTFSYRATNQDKDEDDDPSSGNYFCCTQTRRFEIRRLGHLNDNNNYSLEKMMRIDGDGGIGEQGVFLGQLGTVSLRNGVDGVVAHRIAFATKDSDLFVEKKGLGEQRFFDGQVERVGRKFHVFEQGVYHVRDGTMQTQSRINARLYSGSVTGWFTPKLF